MKKLALLSVFMFLGNIINAQTLEIIGNGNLRSGPSTSHEVIAKVTIGMKVNQLDFSNDWYKIEITKELSGWVYKSLVKIEKPIGMSNPQTQNFSGIPIQTKLTFDKFNLLVGFTSEGGQCLWKQSTITGSYQQISNNDTVKANIVDILSVLGSDKQERLGILLEGTFFVNPQLIKNPIKEFSNVTEYKVVKEIIIDGTKLILAEGKGVLLIDKSTSDDLANKILKRMGISGGGAIFTTLSNEEVGKLTPMVNGSGLIGVQPMIKIK